MLLSAAATPDMFWEKADTSKMSLHQGQQSEPVIPLQVEYILSVVIVIFVVSLVHIFWKMFL